MAIRAPMAEWHPFKGKGSTALQQDLIVLHTMVGSLRGSWDWANRAGNPYWHFGLGGNGELWQCHDLAFRSAANLNGNWRCIPIETADMGEGIFPVPWANPLWTDDQIDALVELIAWLCARFDIPPILIPDTRPGRRGIGYHRQGVDPWRVEGGELWSKAKGKICPAARIEQLVDQVIPRVQSRLGTQGGFLMALSDKKQDEIYEAIVGDGRLKEVTLAARKIGHTPPPGYFAKATGSGNTGPVYYVAASHQSKLPMDVGGPVHEWLKTLAALNQSPENAIELDPEILAGIPTAVVPEAVPEP